jgi:AICAR transformylase/IMP cyclohydrolase PurH
VSLSGDYPKVALINREYFSTMRFGASNHRSVSKTEGKISVATSQMVDTAEMSLTTLQDVRAAVQIVK